jgi:hypothetical protein
MLTPTTIAWIFTVLKWVIIAAIVIAIAVLLYNKFLKKEETESGSHCRSSDASEWQDRRRRNWVEASAVYPKLDEELMPGVWFTNAGYRSRSLFQTPGVLPSCATCPTGPSTYYAMSGYYPEARATFDQTGKYESVSKGFVGDAYSKGGLLRDAWNPGPAGAFQPLALPPNSKQYVMETNIAGDLYPAGGSHGVSKAALRGEIMRT